MKKYRLVYVICALCAVAVIGKWRTAYAADKPEKPEEPKKGVLLITLDESQMYLGYEDESPADTRRRLMQGDTRFRESGWIASFGVWIYPKAKLAKDCKERKAETLKAVWMDRSYTPDEMNDDKIAGELKEISERLAKGEAVHLYFTPYLVSETRPARLELPPGRYYFRYGFNLNHNNQFGTNRLVGGSPSTTGKGAWGPLSVTVTAGDKTTVTVRPCIATSHLRWQYEQWLDALNDADLAP